jgi:DNA-binding winged helix-turn-helix (wHTH) protein/TolB-like protein
MNERNGRAVYEFDEFSVDMATRQLFRNRIPVDITPKAFDTLAALVTRGGETVSKAELINHVWAETAVEENNLTQQISAIRRALGVGARDHRFIVTVPGRGYCFVASLRKSDENALVESNQRKPHRFDPSSVFGIGLAVSYVLIVCMPMSILGLRGALVKPQTVAVLAFKTVGDNRDEPLGMGIRDTLRAKLGTLDDVAVRPADSHLESQDAIIAGRRLKADVVLTGSIQHDDNKIRIAVEIVDVSNERVVWGKTFDQDTSNVFGLQDSIAGEVIQALQRPRLLSGRKPREKRSDMGSNTSPHFAFLF